MNPTQRISCFYGFAKALSLFVFVVFSTISVAQVSVSISGTSPTCNGWTNGTLTATATGGVGPYSYAWSNGFSDATIVGLSAGSFSVTATDANGQSANASFNLTQPPVLTVTVSLSNVCAGGGNAAATVSGGVAPYAYSWDNGATGASTSGLSAGLHCVTVTDAVGCQKVECVNVPSAMAINMVVQGLACFNFCDASVEAVVTGGTPPYSYNWSNGATGSVNMNLGPGTYSVTVTDVNGCTVSGTSTVGNPVQIQVNVAVTNPPCGAGGVGSATASATGGTPPYSFLWNFGATSATVTGLVPGTYSVVVTDFLGCTQTGTAIIVPAGSIQVQVQTNPSSGCGLANGSATAVPSGGTAPYTFHWSNNANTATATGLAPGTYTVMVTDANGCGATATTTIAGSPAIDLHISGVNGGCAANGSANAMVTPGTGTAPFNFLWNTGATTPIINNLNAGTYSVTVTDAAGCTATDQVTVTGSSSIAVTATGTNVSCFSGNNGTATANVTGATGNILYMWSNGGMTETISGLTANTYFVTVTDQGSGCTANTSVLITQPTELVATATSMNAGCSGLGSATAAASGGTAPYTFTWSNNATGTTITGLAAGAYMVTATDSRGCTDVAMTTVSGTGSPNVTLTVTPLSGNGANDGKLTASTTGGTAPYTYLWSNGATTSMISNLVAGSYSVTVTDANGCTDTETGVISEPACIGDRVWMDMDRDGCQEGTEGGMEGITVMLTGTDIFGNAVNLTQTTSSIGAYKFDNLAPGTYTVKVTAPANHSFSPSNACSNDFTDSDANSSGSAGPITLTAGQCNTTIDFGLYDNCLNVADPGTICCDQTLCGPGVDPAPITSLTPASGGVGQIQYMWMYSTDSPNFNTGQWNAITDPNGVPIATSASYDPGPLSQTTYFIRCVRTATCSDWKESNTVTITVDDVAVAEIIGPDVLCVNKATTFTATTNGGNATYHWNFGFWASPATSNQQTATVTYSSWGVTNITLTVTRNGCTSTDVLPISISNDPLICGNAITINVENRKSTVMVGWDLEKAPGNIEYVVQRSSDGVIFSDLGSVPQAVEEGLNHYTFEDKSPKSGNAFYRIEVRESGQHYIYSKAERVSRFGFKNLMMVYPNPVTDHLVIESSEHVKTGVSVEIFSMEGKLVHKESIAEGAVFHTVQLPDMKAGSYQIKFTYNNGQKELIRFVKY
jgi:hypothetical protein